MNLKKKVSTLAVVGVMAMTAVASAANIGLVNMNQVVSSYPGYGALDMKMKAIETTYRPQIEKANTAVSKISDKTKAEAEFNAKVAPLVKKANEEINAVAEPMMQDIHTKIEAVRVAKGLDIVVDDPYTIQAAAADSKVENITNDVIAKLK